jgi:hypothetical protein
MAHIVHATVEEPATGDELRSDDERVDEAVCRLLSSYGWLVVIVISFVLLETVGRLAQALLP